MLGGHGRLLKKEENSQHLQQGQGCPRNLVTALLLFSWFFPLTVLATVYHGSTRVSLSVQAALWFTSYVTYHSGESQWQEVGITGRTSQTPLILTDSAEEECLAGSKKSLSSCLKDHFLHTSPNLFDLIRCFSLSFLLVFIPQNSVIKLPPPSSYFHSLCPEHSSLLYL